MAESEVTRKVGRYEIIRPLGAGGVGVVYLARQLDLGRMVALKELSRFERASHESAERFLREARLVGSLSHPNIVVVHEYFEQEGVPYIAMEYVPRGTLRPYVGHLRLPQIVGVLEGVLAGLAYAESKGIVHRDLKPENLMVSEEGHVKIADFGIAKATQSAGMTASLTATGAAIGTPTYMAPEQARAQEVGPWTDLYSVGIMTYEHLTGQPPFHDQSWMAVLMRHINDPIPPVIDIKPDVDRRLSDWIDRLLVKDPAARTRSAVDAWDTLEEIVISLLGPRWRRNARLDDPDRRLRTSRPLTPAPFPTDSGDTPAQHGRPPPGGSLATPLRTHPEGDDPSPDTAATRVPPPASASSRRVPRRRVLLAALLAAAVVAAIVLVAASGTGDKKPGHSVHASTGAAPSSARVSPAVPVSHQRLAGGIAVAGPIALTTGGRPAGIVVGPSGDAWVADTADDLLVLVRQDGSELRTVVGRAPVSVALDRRNGNLWVVNRGSGDVTVVDEDGNYVKRSIKVGSAPGSITIGYGAAWVANTGDSSVTRIALNTFSTARIPVGASPTSIVTYNRRVWVGLSNQSVTVLSAITGAYNGRVPGLGAPGVPVALAVTPPDVWVVRSAPGGRPGLSAIDSRIAMARQAEPSICVPRVYPDPRLRGGGSSRCG